MKLEIENGFAFILEGDTEKEFYYSLLSYLCQKHGATLTREVDTSNPDINYILQKKSGASLVKFNVVNTITQIPRAGNWFNTQCVGKYATANGWYVFLCYDQDDYKGNISKFYQGDWSVLRNLLKKAVQVVDVAATADIEDVMLQDIDHICQFVGCVPPVVLKGGKGKVKLKRLFLDHGKCYHEGKRAKDLIDTLDMEVLINGNLVPLQEIERLLFK